MDSNGFGRVSYRLNSGEQFSVGSETGDITLVETPRKFSELNITAFDNQGMPPSLDSDAIVKVSFNVYILDVYILDD